MLFLNGVNANLQCSLHFLIWMKFVTDVYKNVLFDDSELRESTLRESPAFLIGVNEFLCPLSAYVP